MNPLRTEYHGWATVRLERKEEAILQSSYRRPNEMGNMSAEQTYQMKMLINLREQLDHQIDRCIERVASGTFDEKICVIELNNILFSHGLVHGILEGGD